MPRVIARVNHPKNHWLFNESWGVDIAVSTPHLLSALVEEAVSVGSLVRLLEFEGGNARLVEVTLAERSPAAGADDRRASACPAARRSSRSCATASVVVPRARHAARGRRRGACCS